MSVRKRAKIILMILTVFMLTIPVIGTVAYLMDSDSVENTFEIGVVNSDIQETMNDTKTEKSDVYFTNTGTADVYIRAKILIYYEDAEGTILGTLPIKDTDYKIEWGDTFATDWFEQDGYYYYKSVLTEKAKTSNLIKRCTDLLPNDDAYLVVDIVTQTVQATPASMVEEIWSVNVNTDGTLSKKGGTT